MLINISIDFSSSKEFPIDCIFPIAKNGIQSSWNSVSKCFNYVFSSLHLLQQPYFSFSLNKEFHLCRWIEPYWLWLCLVAWTCFACFSFQRTMCSLEEKKKYRIAFNHRHQCVPHNTRHRHLFCCPQTNWIKSPFFFHWKVNDSCKIRHNNSQKHVIVFLCRWISGEEATQPNGATIGRKKKKKQRFIVTLSQSHCECNVLVYVRDNDNIKSQILMKRKK